MKSGKQSQWTKPSETNVFKASDVAFIRDVFPERVLPW